MRLPLLCILFLGAILFLPVAKIQAQDQRTVEPIRISGSLKGDFLRPQNDEKIGTENVTDRILNNTSLALTLSYRNIEAGGRYEYQQHPLPGYEPDFKGAGIPYLYVKGRWGVGEVTLGSYYEQFGAGLILRTYEEPSLGIDNHLRGARLVLAPTKGLRLKALAGRQRRYWTTNSAMIYGADAEWNVASLLHGLGAPGTQLTLGLSWVTRHERQDALARLSTGESSNPGFYQQYLVQPENVGAIDARIALRRRRFNVSLEYAEKGQDPSFDNGYTYGRGTAWLLSTGWSKQGMSVFVQAKRAENMSFRSHRTDGATASFLNHLPPFTPQPTYSLTAIYPYATQNVPGEWAFQGEWTSTLPRRSVLGGRYGTLLRWHGAQIFDLGLKRNVGGALPPMGTDGFRTKGFWAMGKTRYREFGWDVERRLSSAVKIHAAYLWQYYDKAAIEGDGETIHAHIGIAESRWQLSRKLAIRAEAQYLHTRQDQRDWWAALVEVSCLPHFMFTLADQYNAHVRSAATGREHAIHYLQGFVTYTRGSYRLQLGYGKTRSGYNCAGGVCRFVPAQKGFTLAYTYNF